MPLPEKEYFVLEEIEERWGMRRRDTIYYAENDLLEIATRVRGVVIQTGIFEAEPDGHRFRIPEDHSRYSGLLTLLACDLAILLRRNSTTIHSFHAGDKRYGDIAEPEDGIEVHACDLVVTRAERDRFEQAHELAAHLEVKASRTVPAMPPISCSDDGGWIKVHGRTYLFSGVLQKTAIRYLYDAWESGTPRLSMHALMDSVQSDSRHISQLFSAGTGWREIVGYGSGYVWLKAAPNRAV